MNTRLHARSEPMPAPRIQNLKLIYLAGAPHSGSTILESILTASPSIRGLGQFGRFYAYPDFDACSCGEAPASCVPCKVVTTQVVEPFGTDKYRRIGRLTRREWGLPLFLASSRICRQYRTPSEDAFHAVASACETTVLLDSSKSISRGLALIDSTELEVIVVHTVRDFAGFVASREKRTQKAGTGRDILRLWKWLVKNAMVVSLLQPRASSFITVRFEDLAADPEGEIERLCREIDIDPADSIARLANGDELQRTHLFEPPRQFDYRGVVFDPSRRSASTTIDHVRRSRLWKLGGRFGSRWGYVEKTPNLGDHPADERSRS